MPSCGASWPCSGPRSPARDWARTPRSCTTCAWRHAACAPRWISSPRSCPSGAATSEVSSAGWPASWVRSATSMCSWRRRRPWSNRGRRSSGPTSPRLLRREREAARAELLAALDSVRWERLVSGMAAMVQQGPFRRSTATRLAALVAVPDLICSRHAAVVKAARAGQALGRGGRLPPPPHPLQATPLLARVRGRALRRADEPLHPATGQAPEPTRSDAGRRGGGHPPGRAGDRRRRTCPPPPSS